MKFMQVIEYRTAQFDEVNKLMDAWLAQTEGKRTVGQASQVVTVKTPTGTST